MRRLLASAILGLGVSLAAWGAPARFLHEPTPPARLPAPASIDLRGTHWKGYNNGVKMDWTVYFEPDGSFTYSYGGTTYRNGTWSLQGNKLYYQVNKKYCECTCIVNGDRIEGESWNVAGLRWQILLHPLSSAK